MVLEPERGTRPHREAGPLPAQPPDHLPARPGDLVNRRRVAGRDDQVPVRRDRDRVDVQVVERGGFGPAGERDVGIGDRHVVDAAPLEQHPAGGDVDLLDDAGQRHPVAGPAQRRQVGRYLAVGGDERGVLRGDDELVQVDLEPVARLDGGDGAVGAVGDHRLALAVALDDLAFPPGEHGLPAVGLHVEVDPALAVARGEPGVRRVPDDAAIPVQDHQARHAGSVQRVARRRDDEVGRVRRIRQGDIAAVRDRSPPGGCRSGRLTNCRTPGLAAVTGGAFGITVCRLRRRGMRYRVPDQARRAQPGHSRGRRPAAGKQLPPGQPSSSVICHVSPPSPCSRYRFTFRPGKRNGKVSKESSESSPEPDRKAGRPPGADRSCPAGS